MTENVVTHWFGPHFSALHPLLQDLHRQGGQLHGEVLIKLGRGAGAWLGKRLARKLGIPTDLAQRGFTVNIGHAADGLHWDRHFAGGACLYSRFVPVGVWPDGHWLEHTGPLQMRLTVDVVDGGWHWRLLGVKLGSLPLPIWLFPKTRAYKCIENGKYRFSVAFALPLVGDILSYQGLLEMN